MRFLLKQVMRKKALETIDSGCHSFSLSAPGPPQHQQPPPHVPVTTVTHQAIPVIMDPKSLESSFKTQFPSFSLSGNLCTLM